MAESGGNFLSDAVLAFEERRFDDGRRALVDAALAHLDDDAAFEQLAWQLGELVSSCWSEGSLDELRPAVERVAVAALAQRPQHPATPRILSCLGWTFAWTGDHGSAEPLFARALALRLQQGVAPPLERAHAFADLGESRLARGDHESSVPLLERALTILDHEQPDGLVLARVAHLLAFLEAHRGRYERAATLYARAIAIREGRLRFDHPSLARASAELAEVLLCLGRTAEAEEAARRALSVFERSRAATDPELARCRALVGIFENS